MLPNIYARRAGLSTPVRPGDEAGADDFKHFATLRARLALAGYCLSRTSSNDGPVRYYVSRCGVVRELQSLTALNSFADEVEATNA